MQRRQTLGALILGFSAVLSACTTPEDITQEYSGLSCMDLAREIGRAEGFKESANADEIGAGLDIILADEDYEFVEAGIEAIIASSTKSDANTRMDILQETLVRNGCRS
ncbi:MAG: hypothetical protein AAFQ24_10120 [Pseudomonadota bacterium]